MESQMVRLPDGSRVRELAADLKDRCGDFFSRSLSLLRGLFVASDGGADPEIPDVRPDRGRVPKWVKIMAGLSVTPVMEVSIGYVQVQRQLPTEFTFFCLAVLLAFDCFFVASCIYRKFPNPTRVLQKAGVFLMFTGVFIIVPVPFPRYFKIITWAVYGISVTAVLVTHYFNPQ